MNYLALCTPSGLLPLKLQPLPALGPPFLSPLLLPHRLLRRQRRRHRRLRCCQLRPCLHRGTRRLFRVHPPLNDGQSVRGLCRLEVEVLECGDGAGGAGVVVAIVVVGDGAMVPGVIPCAISKIVRSIMSSGLSVNVDHVGTYFHLSLVGRCYRFPNKFLVAQQSSCHMMSSCEYWYPATHMIEYRWCCWQYSVVGWCCCHKIRVLYAPSKKKTLQQKPGNSGSRYPQPAKSNVHGGLGLAPATGARGRGPMGMMMDERAPPAQATSPCPPPPKHASVPKKHAAATTG